MAESCQLPRAERCCAGGALPPPRAASPAWAWGGAAVCRAALLLLPGQGWGPGVASLLPQHAGAAWVPAGKLQRLGRGDGSNEGREGSSGGVAAGVRALHLRAESPSVCRHRAWAGGALRTSLGARGHREQERGWGTGEKGLGWAQLQGRASRWPPGTSGAGNRQWQLGAQFVCCVPRVK